MNNKYSRHFSIEMNSIEARLVFFDLAVQVPKEEYDLLCRTYNYFSEIINFRELQYAHDNQMMTI